MSLLQDGWCIFMVSNLDATMALFSTSFTGHIPIDRKNLQKAKDAINQTVVRKIKKWGSESKNIQPSFKNKISRIHTVVQLRFPQKEQDLARADLPISRKVPPNPERDRYFS